MQPRVTRCEVQTDAEPKHTYGPVAIDAQRLGRIPAAEYLRVSRCDQTNGLVAQARSIRAYADTRGFLVVKTYVDHGRTGLVIRGRKGLQKLMEDVLGGSATYKAVLVNDVSRWGRFQDSDEAAHYEFLCKQAGVPIHYCSETCAKFPASAQAILKNIR